MHGETSSLGTDNKIWIGAETSDGINFGISLCTEPSPGFSHLFLKTDDAVAVTPTSTVFCDGVKKRLHVEALTSCYNAILMQTIVDTRTYPYFYHDYFLLKNDVPSPVISRLPEIPGGPDLNFGLLHQSGRYTVAVLKEGMPLTTARSSSIDNWKALLWQLKGRHVYASYLPQQENGKLRVSLSLMILLPGIGTFIQCLPMKVVFGGWICAVESSLMILTSTNLLLGSSHFQPHV